MKLRKQVHSNVGLSVVPVRACDVRPSSVLVTVFATAPVGRGPFGAAVGWYPRHWDRVPSTRNDRAIGGIPTRCAESEQGARPCGGTRTTWCLACNGCTRTIRPVFALPAARRATGGWSALVDNFAA